MYGLECLFNVTEWHKKKTWAVLKDEPIDNGPSIQMMMLRARMNSQRCYEIYSFVADEGVTEESIRQTFKESPQGLVEFIRKNGEKIYSDRIETKKQVIT
jgi:hypothetical protein